MYDTAPGSHPLDITGGDCPTITYAVTVLDCSGKNIRYCFDSPVGMPRKSCEVISRDVVSEIIKKKKRIEIRGVTETDGDGPPLLPGSAWLE